MNDLVKLEEINAVEVFSGQGLDDLLLKITEEARSIVPDLTTKKGRDEIASMAHKVAKSKTYLDGLRKDLVSEWKTKAKAVDAEGKKMRDTLDALKAEVRQPLTEWETEEENRVKAHESNIAEMREGGEHTLNSWLDISVEAMTDRLTEIENEGIESYEEFAPVAAGVKDRAITQIKEAIEKREAYDKEQKELEQLRAEAAEREKKEAEEKLRVEGEERAKREAEAKAEEEKERVRLEAEKAEQEKQAAIQAQKDAEIRAEQAEENAKIEAEKAKENARIEAEKAAQAERDRIESERLAEEIAAKKREANKAHKTKINNAVLDALVLTGMNKTQAKKAVTAIAKGEVPYTTISY